MEKQNLTKVTMNLSDKTIRNIDDLRELIGSGNRTQIVAGSVVIALSILAQMKEGKKVILRYENGLEQEIKFII